MNIHLCTSEQVYVIMPNLEEVFNLWLFNGNTANFLPLFKAK